MIEPSLQFPNFDSYRFLPNLQMRKLSLQMAICLMQHRHRRLWKEIRTRWELRRGREGRSPGNQSSGSRAGVSLRRGTFGMLSMATVPKAIRTHSNCSLIRGCHPQVGHLYFCLFSVHIPQNAPACGEPESLLPQGLGTQVERAS